jgi:hypothetical protein
VASLHRALEIEPDSLDFLYALADYYAKRGMYPQARTIAEQMMSKHPDSPTGKSLLDFLKTQLPPENSEQIGE